MGIRAGEIDVLGGDWFVDLIFCNNLCYSTYMRTIINISLPKELNKVVENEVRHGKFASKSEFFRMLLRAWEDGKLAAEFRNNRKDFEAGRGGKLLRSLKDLG